MLVGLFNKEIHLALVQKLVEIGQLRSLDLLDNWYKKAMNFERLRREAIKELKGKKTIEKSGDNRKKSVLDVLR